MKQNSLNHNNILKNVVTDILLSIIKNIDDKNKTVENKVTQKEINDYNNDFFYRLFYYHQEMKMKIVHILIGNEKEINDNNEINIFNSEGYCESERVRENLENKLLYGIMINIRNKLFCCESNTENSIERKVLMLDNEISEQHVNNSNLDENRKSQFASFQRKKNILENLEYHWIFGDRNKFIYFILHTIYNDKTIRENVSLLTTDYNMCLIMKLCEDFLSHKNATYMNINEKNAACVIRSIVHNIVYKYSMGRELIL